MGILKDIWNTIFGKSKKQEKFGRGGSIEEPKMQVIYKKENKKVIGGYKSGDTQPDKSKSCSYKDVTHTFCEPNFTPKSYGVCNPPAIIPNGDDFFASKELIEKEKIMDDEVNRLVKNKKNKNVIGQKTLSEIKDYLLTYGSIDVLTCKQKFKVKSLHNFIWHLRKEGLKIKTNKVGLHNELGQKVDVTNYILITKQ